MSEPRLLDLFGGAGGAGSGYHRAGFEVVGVDIEPQPHYPFECIQADVLELLETAEWWEPFAAVHASPPCQRWAARSAEARAKHPDLITPLRPMLVASGLPYVIENVVRAPLREPVRLCGSSFGLRVRRHRAFESNVLIGGVACDHASQGDNFVTVAGGGPNPASFRRGPNATGGPDRKPRNLADALDAMGIDWHMSRAEVNEAIPPAFTEHVGGYLMAAVQAKAAAA